MIDTVKQLIADCDRLLEHSGGQLIAAQNRRYQVETLCKVKGIDATNKYRAIGRRKRLFKLRDGCNTNVKTFEDIIARARVERARMVGVLNQLQGKLNVPASACVEDSQHD